MIQSNDVVTSSNEVIQTLLSSSAIIIMRLYTTLPGSHWYGFKWELSVQNQSTEGYFGLEPKPQLFFLNTTNEEFVRKNR